MLDITKEVSLINISSRREVFENLSRVKGLFKEETQEVLVGLALIKSGFTLPGFRILYRNSTVESLKKIFSNLLLLPKDIANIYFQFVSLNDVKLYRFINSMGILPSGISVKAIDAFDVRTIVVNGMPDDLNSTKINYEDMPVSLNYYVDSNYRITVLMNGSKFVLPREVTEFVEDGFFSISLKSVFNFGLPDERVFFEIRKTVSNDDIIPYFDPMIKIEALLSKLESERYVDFFYEFISLLATDFEIVSRNKSVIIQSLDNKDMLWILMEIKNILSYLYNQEPSNTLRNIIKNVEIFLDDFNFNSLFEKDVIRIITPLFDQDKYVGVSEYIKNSTKNEVILLSDSSEIKVILKNGVVVGKINNNTSRLLAELGGIIRSPKLFAPKSLIIANNYLNHNLDCWLELYLIRV